MQFNYAMAIHLQILMSVRRVIWTTAGVLSNALIYQAVLSVFAAIVSQVSQTNTVPIIIIIIIIISVFIHNNRTFYRPSAFQY